MILDREQFCDHIDSVTPGLSDPIGPLWIPELQHRKRFTWFLKIHPVECDPEFWEFTKSLRGKIACFSSGMNGDTLETWEWWGFTRRDDIVLFLMRWS